jgi:excisionase family DNA binding protein
MDSDYREVGPLVAILKGGAAHVRHAGLWFAACLPTANRRIFATIMPIDQGGGKGRVMADQNDWIGLGEAAAILGVHPTTLRHWADQGDLPSQRTPGGHRRFQRGVIEHWLTRGAAQQADAPSEAQMMLHSALGHARLQVGGGQLVGQPWYDRLDEQARQSNRELGRTLLELLTRYLAGEEDRVGLLREARALGATYAHLSLAQGLTLSETVQAFLFFRDLLIDSVIQLAELLSLHTPLDWGNRMRQVNRLTDELFLSLIEEHEAGARG